jgi:AcrR family transcriptional regulator
MAALAPVANPRRRALDAAALILENEGEAALSLRAIAAATDTGVASLYYHFRNKDALLAELAIDGFADLGAALAAAVRAPGHRRTFHACAEAYVGFTRHRPRLYGLMYNERLLAGHARLRAAEATAFAAFRRGIVGFDVEGEELDAVAMTFWALGRGIASISSASGSPRAGAAKRVVHKILRGLEILTGVTVKARGPAPADQPAQERKKSVDRPL